MQEPINCTTKELSTYLRALAAGYLPTCCWDTGPSAPSKSMRIAGKCYRNGKKTECFPGFRFSMMLRNLTAGRGGESSTSCAADFRAKTSVAPATELELPERNHRSGSRCCGSFARFDRVTFSWKTPTDLFGEDSTLCSAGWPRAGTMRNGACFPQAALAPRIFVTGAGFSVGTPTTRNKKFSKRFGDGRTPGVSEFVTMFPTPTVNGNNNRKGLSKSSGDGLATFVKRSWTTPSASDAGRGGTITENMTGRSLRQEVGGTLNPDWVEWLMGWPVGWTDVSQNCNENAGHWLEQKNSWFATEPVERVTKTREHRAKRIKAIGNGQVPLCAATAFEMLYRRINET